MGTSSTKVGIGCFGQKKCPKDWSNASRWLCPFYESCINRYILGELERGNSLSVVLRGLRDVVNCGETYGATDYVHAMWIGQVAFANGNVFGRKKVDRMLKESCVNEDVEALFEEKEIRRCFGVYGRKGAHRHCRRNLHIGRTVGHGIAQEATS